MFQKAGEKGKNSLARDSSDIGMSRSDYNNDYIINYS